MSKIDNTTASAASGTIIDDLEVPRYILEMVAQLQRLATRAGDTELSGDLAIVRARAANRKKRRLN